MNVPRDFLEENTARYRQLIRGETPDWAPFRFWADDLCIKKLTGVDYQAYKTDLEVQLAAQRKFNERFYDLHPYTLYTDTMGVYFDQEKFAADHPNAPHPCRFLGSSLDDFDKYYVATPIRDVPCIGRLREGLAFYNRDLSREKGVAHYLGAAGAMDLFSIFRGTEHFFLDLYDQPNKVKRLFEYLTERSLALCEYSERELKPFNGDNVLFDKMDIGEDYCAYLPEDLFDEFVKPYTGRIFEQYKGKVLCSLHTDGDMPVSGLHKLGELNVDELMGFSPNIDITEFRKALPDVILGGNIHPIHVMTEGTPEDVLAAARYCFENANQNGRFVLCTGGSMSENTKPENIDAFVQAAYEVVRY